MLFFNHFYILIRNIYEKNSKKKTQGATSNTNYEQSNFLNTRFLKGKLFIKFTLYQEEGEEEYTVTVSLLLHWTKWITRNIVYES